MKFTCHDCGRTTNWDPVQMGGSHPPDYVTTENEGEMRTFCRACWPPQEEINIEDDNDDR